MSAAHHRTRYHDHALHQTGFNVYSGLYGCVSAETLMHTVVMKTTKPNYSEFFCAMAIDEAPPLLGHDLNNLLYPILSAHHHSSIVAISVITHGGTA